MSLKEINMENIWPIIGIGACSLFTLGVVISFCKKGEKKEEGDKFEEEKKEDKKEEIIKEEEKKDKNKKKK